MGKDLVLTAIKSWDFSAFLSLILTMRGVAVWPGGGGGEGGGGRCRERVMKERRETTEYIGEGGE